VPYLYHVGRNCWRATIAILISICHPNLSSPRADRIAGHSKVVASLVSPRSRWLRTSAEATAMVARRAGAGRVSAGLSSTTGRAAMVAVLKRHIDEGGLGRIIFLPRQASWMRRSGIPSLGRWFTNKRPGAGR
jgi:hypothetical protein